MKGTLALARSLYQKQKRLFFAFYADFIKISLKFSYLSIILLQFCGDAGGWSGCVLRTAENEVLYVENDFRVQECITIGQAPQWLLLYNIFPVHLVYSSGIYNNHDIAQRIENRALPHPFYSP